MALRVGLHQFENVRLEPIQLADCDGAMHEFHFRTRLLGDILSLEGFELIDGEPAGYQFQLVGHAEEEVFSLLGRLIQKIRRSEFRATSSVSATPAPSRRKEASPPK